MTSTLGPDLLRGWSDQELSALLRSRPDLVVPAPADLTALAARVQSRSSVARVLDRLTRFQLEVLDALRLTRDPDGTTSLGAVLAVTAAAGGVDAAAVRDAVQRLRAYLLIYGDGTFRVVPTVDELLGPYPAGLGRPAGELDPEVAALVAEPARLRRTLLTAPQPARAVLDRLAAGPPVGTTDPAEGPVAWLVEHRLLAATSPNTVELPREVGVLLRREQAPMGPLHPTPPVPAATVTSADADAAGAGQAMEAVRRAEVLVEVLAAEPAPLRRSGELGIRELRRIARAAGVDEPEAGLLIEAGYAAGLLGELDAGATLIPTIGYDGWRGAPLAARWHALVIGWLAAPQTPMGAPAGGRRAVLRLLAGLPPGTAPTAAEVRELIEWYAPRQAGLVRDAPQVLTEAALLGVTGRDALTSYGAALLGDPAEEREDDPLGIRAGDRPAGLPPAAARLDGLLPVPVDQVLVQADLTVVVPGPPEHTLATELALVADPESTGVHRVSGESLRRALDAGYTAEDLHALFDRRSRTPVPQGLRYLIDDVARRHGGLRVGTTRAYLRSDDEVLVAQVLADRRLVDLGLRRLAPTVLASAVPSGRLLAGLREAGYAPVAEDATGAAVLVRPERRRAPARAAVAPPVEPRFSTPRLLGIIEDLRRAEAAARAARRAPAAVVRANGAPVAGAAAAQAHADAMAVLQQAVREKTLVWVGYLDSHGERTSRLLRPVSIGAGYLRAEDERTDTLHTLALHRITAAALDE